MTGGRAYALWWGAHISTGRGPWQGIRASNPFQRVRGCCMIPVSFTRYFFIVVVVCMKSAGTKYMSFSTYFVHCFACFGCRASYPGCANTCPLIGYRTAVTALLFFARTIEYLISGMYAVTAGTGDHSPPLACGLRLAVLLLSFSSNVKQ